MRRQDSFYLNHILTPSTEQFLFGKQLLDPLLRGENITILSLPHGGIRKKMRYFVGKIGEFYPNLEKTIFVYLDPNDLSEDSPEGYFRMMTILIDNKETTCQYPLLALKEKIVKYLSAGYRLIFILGYFYKLDYPTAFFNSLFGLHQIDRQKVGFIFTSAKNIFIRENLCRFGALRELLTQNIIYFPVFSDDDALFMVRNFALKHGYSISKEKEELIVRLAGGHPTLILFCLRVIAGFESTEIKKTFDHVFQRQEIKIILENIWESFVSEEKDFLLQIINKRKISGGVHLNHLKKLGVIDQRLMIFSPLMEAFIKEKKPRSALVHISEDEKQVLIDGHPPKGKISARDYKLLASFSRNPGRIVSRDEIAEILWDKLSYDKYSDWAIDRAIFSLRKKLTGFGVSPDVLQTVKGLGYRLVT
ncbi:MAG: winged helix-turn-helix domain-containing protein [Patescibacteria group bacterium]|jgi:DNA-binding winged helix-turn-helix (wHTH) protein